jgi:hypothetical protein
MVRCNMDGNGDLFVYDSDFPRGVGDGMIADCVALSTAFFLAGACFQDFMNTREVGDLLWTIVGLVIGAFYLIVLIGRAANTAAVMYAI